MIISNHSHRHIFNSSYFLKILTTIEFWFVYSFLHIQKIFKCYDWLILHWRQALKKIPSKVENFELSSAWDLETLSHYLRVKNFELWKSRVVTSQLELWRHNSRFQIFSSLGVTRSFYSYKNIELNSSRFISEYKLRVIFCY